MHGQRESVTLICALLRSNIGAFISRVLLAEVLAVSMDSHHMLYCLKGNWGHNYP